jgi:predicted transcriptional regulator
MAKKNTKPKADAERAYRHAIQVRLSDEEKQKVDADIKATAMSAGFPVSDSAYAKKATLEFPRLHALEKRLKELANGASSEASAVIATRILDEVTQ